MDHNQQSLKIDKFRHAIDNNDTVAMSIAYANIAMFISTNTVCDSIIIKINNIIREKIDRIFTMIILYHGFMKLLYNIIVFAYLINVANNESQLAQLVMILIDILFIASLVIGAVIHDRRPVHDVHFDMAGIFCETTLIFDMECMFFGMTYPFSDNTICLINFIYAFIMIISFFVLRNQTKPFTILYIDEDTYLL